MDLKNPDLSLFSRAKARPVWLEKYLIVEINETKLAFRQEIPFSKYIFKMILEGDY